MHNTKQKSCIGSLVDAVLSIWGMFVVACGVAMIVHLFNTGLNIIPQWVLSISGGLFSAAFLVAYKKNVFKGLWLGLSMLAAVAFTLAFQRILLGADQSEAPMHQMLMAMTNMIIYGGPIFAGLYAIMWPLLFQPSEQQR